MNIKIISFSLWGNNPKYTVGAIKNAKLASVFYPGWICRFYIGQSTLVHSKRIVKELKKLDNVEIVEMKEEGDWNGMFWRFLPASDLDVDIMISRDTDSRLSYREAIAVNEWIESGKSFHIMKDHPYHTAKIMGGMWGVRGNILIDMKSLIEDYKKGNFWQVDQNFLSEIIFNKIKDDCFIHDEFFENKSFPIDRDKNFSFVGEVFDAQDNPNIEHRRILKNSIMKK